MTIYTNWKNEKVISEGTYLDLVKAYVKEHSNDNEFYNWLDDYYSPSKLFIRLVNTAPYEVRKDYLEYLEDEAIAKLKSEGYSVYDLDTEEE